MRKTKKLCKIMRERNITYLSKITHLIIDKNHLKSYNILEKEFIKNGY